MRWRATRQLREARRRDRERRAASSAWARAQGSDLRFARASYRAYLEKAASR